MKSLRWRVAIVVVFILVALWSLWPTFRYYSMSPQERAKLPRSKLASLQKRSLNLGLDLQGGMYLLLEVDKSKLSPEEAKGAVDRAIEVIRNRVDQWGVFEPSIQKVGEDRILIQLPGVLDRERARQLIGKTALLEFRLVAPDNLIMETLERIDRKLAAVDSADTNSRPFTSLLNSYRGNIVVPEDNVAKVDSLLKDPRVKEAIPKGYVFMWGKWFESNGQKFRSLYLVEAKPELTGAYLKDARHTIGSASDPNIANQPIVLLKFNRKGAARFSEITGRNVGRRLAIVLDGVVQSAPVIRERIPSGNAQITGIGSIEEAKELAVILRAGALPAPVKIIEERSVGPLLGHDSIKSGITALIIGFLLVVIFMVIYYNVSGLIADLALILNLIFIFALLVGFHATLTLPGLAGIILTVGMAVDANVLIFERIREELRAGKTPKMAVNAGYSRATVTVFDANVTTLIAALVLYKFGTGPIRGFGVTLSIGIIVSFFTAIFVTKIVFDYLLTVKKVKTIKI